MQVPPRRSHGQNLDQTVEVPPSRRRNGIRGFGRAVSRILSAPLARRRESFVSNQNQPMLDKRLEIGGVDGRQLCAASNRHRRNHAVGQASRATACLIEQTRGKRGVCIKKRFGIQEYLPREGFAVASSGPHRNSAHAMLLTLKSSRANAQARNRSCTGEPATTIWMRKLVSKCIMQVSHFKMLTSGLANGGHPFHRFLCAELKMILQRIQGFERRQL